MFQYHGAEHKTIYTYEAGLPLEVANVRQFSTLHPRCGTNFLMIVMLISMFVFTFLGWPNLFERIMSRIILMPVIAGVSYEIIRYAGSHIDSAWVRTAIFPGLCLQKLTTREPDDSQIEVAIASLKAVLGSIQRIADELGLKVETVRNYFGGHNFQDGRSCGFHIEPVAVHRIVLYGIARPLVEFPVSE